MNSAAELIARVREGDDEAFGMIFERYSRPVMSFIYHMIGERDAAEELAQDTFVRAYKNIHALRDESKLSVWLFGIAKNVARESLRARRRSGGEVALDDAAAQLLSDGAPLPDNQLLGKELGGVIRKALGSLNEDKRLVFVLREFHQRSYEEIAEITGFSMPKLKGDLHRARAEMRSLIRPYMEVRDEV
ncbi:MAG TPA: sigma-70 family RNA polymerase sigma factor [Pyrinomonadaceae bacterium]|nr:sigma-70 family RNA polymerase sigma factor [Pyrinomonadaceae bacterium]